MDVAAQIYKEDVPPEEQSGKGLNEVLDIVIKKTTEELGHKFNKQQSIANPALGKQFLEEVISLSSPFDYSFSTARYHLSSFLESFIKLNPRSIWTAIVSDY